MDRHEATSMSLLGHRPMYMICTYTYTSGGKGASLCTTPVTKKLSQSPLSTNGLHNCKTSFYNITHFYVQVHQVGHNRKSQSQSLVYVKKACMKL